MQEIWFSKCSRLPQSEDTGYEEATQRLIFLIIVLLLYKYAYPTYLNVSDNL